MNITDVLVCALSDSFCTDIAQRLLIKIKNPLCVAETFYLHALGSKEVSSIYIFFILRQVPLVL